jgi:hypothetical protein
MDPNVVPLIGVVVGIPAIAFSARAVLKPFLDAWVHTRELKAGAGAPRPDPGQTQRILQLEADMSALRDEVARLSAVESFYAQLSAPAVPAPVPAPAPAGADPSTRGEPPPA